MSTANPPTLIKLENPPKKKAQKIIIRKPSKKNESDELYKGPTKIRRKILTETHNQKWTPSQNKVYKNCLIAFYDEVTEQSQRRKSKIFKKISQFFPNRTSEQCRGHHKKMIEKYGTVDKIVEGLGGGLREEKKEVEDGHGRIDWMGKIQWMGDMGEGEMRAIETKIEAGELEMGYMGKIEDIEICCKVQENCVKIEENY